MDATQGPRTPEWCSAKRRQILNGARQVFAELGYERASVDLIAARCGVSKATLYNHFHDKNALFAACFAEGSEQMGAELQALFAETSDDVEGSLQRVGERLLEKFLSSEALSLHRSAQQEAFRQPEIGKMFFERGASVVFELIAGALSRWAARGLLRVDDPYYAAVQFVMLTHGDLVMKIHLGVLREPPPEELRATVRRAVQTFLRAFRA